jgi:hypothetical protein
MNNDIKQKWISALRSGKYKQTKKVLNDGTGMCCLGVLCDLYIQEGGDLKWEFKKPTQALYGPIPSGCENMEVGHIEGGYMILPKPVEIWAELGTRNPIPAFEVVVSAGNSAGKRSLAEFNDSGLTFPQIADVIEYWL